MTRYVVNKSTDHAKPHFDSFLPQYQRQRKCVFFSKRELSIARHIVAASVVCTVIENGKLANEIGRLAAIVVKIIIATTSINISSA